MKNQWKIFFFCYEIIITPIHIKLTARMRELKLLINNAFVQSQTPHSHTSDIFQPDGIYTVL